LFDPPSIFEAETQISGDPEEAVAIEPAEIAGVDPIAIDERSLIVGVVEIATEHAGPRHDHNADLVRCTVALVVSVRVKFEATAD
jgi:hypothetical protein